MLFRSMFPRDLIAEMAHLQRQMEQLFDPDASIRGFGSGSFPAMNIGATPHSLEIYAFVPGLDPDKIELTVEPGVLTLSGERADTLATNRQEATVHLHERFAGGFKRVISLPDDIDPDGVSAQVRDGMLHISIKRRHEAQPKRISVH
jgi:HSP20 family protein